MLKNFSLIWSTKTTDFEKLGAIYHKALRRYPENNLLRAAESCMNELEFFPKPVDLTKRLPRGGSAIDEGKFRIREQVRCTDCGEIRMCIEEPTDCGQWKCRQCYTGMTVKEIQDKLESLMIRMDKGKSKAINPGKILTDSY